MGKLKQFRPNLVPDEIQTKWEQIEILKIDLKLNVKNGDKQKILVSVANWIFELLVHVSDPPPLPYPENVFSMHFLLKKNVKFTIIQNDEDIQRH